MRNDNVELGFKRPFIKILGRRNILRYPGKPLGIECKPFGDLLTCCPAALAEYLQSAFLTLGCLVRVKNRYGDGLTMLYVLTVLG